MKEKLFKQYRRKQIAELRLVTNEDIQAFKNYANNLPTQIDGVWVSISDVDRQNESPKIGDMIARNPKNYNDQWLVAEQYFEDNFESIEVEEKQPEKQSELTMWPKPQLSLKEITDIRTFYELNHVREDTPITGKAAMSLTKRYYEQFQPSPKVSAEKFDTYNLRQILTDIHFAIQEDKPYSINLRNLWNRLSDEITKIEEHGK